MRPRLEDKYIWRWPIFGFLDTFWEYIILIVQHATLSFTPWDKVSGQIKISRVQRIGRMCIERDAPEVTSRCEHDADLEFDLRGQYQGQRLHWE